MLEKSYLVIRRDKSGATVSCVWAQNRPFLYHLYGDNTNWRNRMPQTAIPIDWYLVYVNEFLSASCFPLQCYGRLSSCWQPMGSINYVCQIVNTLTKFVKIGFVVGLVVVSQIIWESISQFVSVQKWHPFRPAHVSDLFIAFGIV